MEPISLATVGTALLGLLGSLGYAHRQRQRRLALEAERHLEQERQESAVQAHLLARMAAMDGRIEALQAQLEDERREARRVKWELEDRIREQADQLHRQALLIAELASDKARMAERIVELEREVAAADGRRATGSAGLVDASGTGAPAHQTDRPPPVRLRRDHAR